MLNVLSGIFNIADLRKKFLFTVGMIILFRLGSHIPVSGIDPLKMASLFKQGNILGFLDLFTGGCGPFFFHGLFRRGRRCVGLDRLAQGL